MAHDKSTGRGDAVHGKVCTKCKEWKPLEDFHRQKQGKYGRTSRCSRCRNAEIALHAERNPGMMEARKLRYRARHPGAGAASSKKYQQANPHVRWERKYKERAEKYGIPLVIEKFTKEDVIRQYGEKCFYCKDAEFTELDHHLAIFDGGPHVLANVRPSCGRCNRQREMDARIHRRTSCSRGHELTPENTLTEGKTRRCRTCRNEKKRESYRKSRAKK